MWSVAQVAERDGVSKPTVSVRVKRFVEQHGLTVERDSQGRVARLNVAEYDALRNRFDDPSKAQAAPPPPTGAGDPPRQSESYDEALRQKTWLETERRRIDLDQLRGKLMETEAVAEGYDRCAIAVRDALERLDEHADDLANVVGREGVRGLQTALKKLGADLLGEISSAIASEATQLRASIVEEPPARPQ